MPQFTVPRKQRKRGAQVLTLDVDRGTIFRYDEETRKRQDSFFASAETRENAGY